MATWVGNEVNGIELCYNYLGSIWFTSKYAA